MGHWDLKPQPYLKQIDQLRVVDGILAWTRGRHACAHPCLVEAPRAIETFLFAIFRLQKDNQQSVATIWMPREREIMFPVKRKVLMERTTIENWRAVGPG